jgi:hypothetical protein
MQIGETVYIQEAAFEDWGRAAKPGRRIVYITGHLAFDRLKKNSSELEAVARLAMDWERRGKVTLVQRRIKMNCWDYIAIKREKFL